MVRSGRSKSCEWCSGQKRRCAETEEGSRKRKGTRPGKKGKGKEREEESESSEMARMRAEMRRLADLVEGMGDELRKVSWGYTKARRELRGFRDLLDEDWEMESESGKSEEGSEEDERVVEELKKLKRRGDVKVGKGWEMARTKKSLKMGKFADKSEESESEDEEEESDNEGKKIDKGKKKEEEPELGPEEPVEDEEDEDEDEDSDDYEEDE
jgi:hypothetical protein